MDLPRRTGQREITPLAAAPAPSWVAAPRRPRSDCSIDAPPHHETSAIAPVVPASGLTPIGAACAPRPRTGRIGREGFARRTRRSRRGSGRVTATMRSVMQADAVAAPYDAPRASSLARWQRRFVAEVTVNGKPVVVEWSRAAQAALARRAQPLTLELELYFSCLVKKFVRFAESPAGSDTADAAARTVAVGEHLRLRFRTVTSTACSIDVAQRLGRQPEVELDGAVARRLAPRRVWLDHRRGTWTADYWM